MSLVTIEPGELTKRLTIEVDVGTDVSNVGQHVEVWAPWDAIAGGQVWAGFRALRGRETERAAMMQVYATHQITVRWIPGLSAVKMRGLLNGRHFDFGWVNNVDEANVKAEILCSERIA